MFNLEKMDNQVPGDVYLCQISESVSCGACCGLYNVGDASRKALTALMVRRTEAFLKLPRNMDAILDFGRKQKLVGKSPFRKFHHCPYIGLVGESRSRVGCLLHPLGNNGVDFRGLSFYGGLACRMYFCPSCHRLPRTYKAILREVAEDWYLYGLLITEREMLNAFFQEIEARLGRLLKKADIVGNPRHIEMVRKFMALKVNWPFRRRPGAGLCNYFFEDRLYSRPRISYKAIGETPSRYDTILRELGSSFDSTESLHKAEHMLDRLFSRLKDEI